VGFLHGRRLTEAHKGRHRHLRDGWLRLVVVPGEEVGKENAGNDDEEERHEPRPDPAGRRAPRTAWRRRLSFRHDACGRLVGRRRRWWVGRRGHGRARYSIGRAAGGLPTTRAAGTEPP